MAWPPDRACRRIAFVVFGLALMLYLTLTGLFFALGLDARATVVAAQLTGLLGLSIWLARLMRLPAREAFALRPAASVHWRMALGAALPLQIAGGALQFTILQRFPEDSAIRQLMEQTIGQFVAVETTLDLVLLFAAAVLTAAICEEFLFRGLILQLLVRRSGWASAILGSSLLFAIFHLNPIVLVPVGLVGAYLALLVWRSGSLYPAILAHGLNNGLALFGLPVFIDEEVYGRFVWLVLLVSSAVFAAILVLYVRATEAPAGPGPATAGAPAHEVASGPDEATAPDDATTRAGDSEPG